MKRVLVVDDQSCIRDVIKDILEDWPTKLDVEECENGMEACVNIECRDYDLLICDVKMPVMDGFEVLKRVREVESSRDMPVIMLTAEDQPDSIWMGATLGATSYVTKPFNLDELMEALRMHI